MAPFNPSVNCDSSLERRIISPVIKGLAGQRTQAANRRFPHHDIIARQALDDMRNGGSIARSFNLCKSRHARPGGWVLNSTLEDLRSAGLQRTSCNRQEEKAS